MKQTLKNLVIFSAVAGLSLVATSTLQAQVEKVAITTSVLEAGNSTTNSHTGAVTTAAPSKKSRSTTDILAELAKDESPAPPADAKLGFNGTGFVLYDASVTNPVSSLTYSPGSSTVLISGTATTNGFGTPPYDEVVYQTATVTYAGGVSGLNFTVTGLATTTTKTTAPLTKPVSKAGNFTASGAFSFQSGTGAGVNTDGNPILLSGFTVTAAGTATENNNLPAD
jgi:hypothetical protein